MEFSRAVLGWLSALGASCVKAFPPGCTLLNLLPAQAFLDLGLPESTLVTSSSPGTNGYRFRKFVRCNFSIFDILSLGIFEVLGAARLSFGAHCNSFWVFGVIFGLSGSTVEWV